MQVIVNPDTTKNDFRVNQDCAVIVDNDTVLKTGGMTTCSALVVAQGNKRMLAHVNSGTPDHGLVYAITTHFNVNDKDALSIQIVPGDGAFGSTTHSMARIMSALHMAGLTSRAVVRKGLYQRFFDDLVVTKSGSVDVAVAPHAEDQPDIVRDGLTYVFASNALTDCVKTMPDGSIQYVTPYDYEHTYQNAIIGPAKGGYDGYVGIYTHAAPAPAKIRSTGLTYIFK